MGKDIEENIHELQKEIDRLEGELHEADIPGSGDSSCMRGLDGCLERSLYQYRQEKEELEKICAMN